MSAPSAARRLRHRLAALCLSAALGLVPVAVRAAGPQPPEVSAVSGLACVHVAPWVCAAPLGSFTFHVTLTRAGARAVASGLSYITEEGADLQVRLGADAAEAAGGVVVPITVAATHAGILQLALGTPAPLTVYVGARRLPPWPGMPHLALPKANRTPPFVLGGPLTSQAQQEKTYLRAIAAARASEGVGAWRLPSNFWRLSAVDQLFVLTNLERTSRGLWPLWAVAPRLDAVALAGARTREDPVYRGAVGWGSNWFSGTDPEQAIFGWMYDDGPGLWNENIDCPAAGAAGCFGHRDNILASWGPYGLFGAAVIPGGGTADLMVSGVVPVTKGIAYTWADAVRMGARPAN